METIVVHGKGNLSGSVRIPGAKNSVLVLLAAAMLCDGDVTLTNVPRLSDVDTSLRILRALGCEAQLRQDAITLQPQPLLQSEIPAALMSAMRSSIFFLAPVLMRTGRVQIGAPGGCKLGARPIDIHLSGLEKMGADITQQGETLLISAPDGLRGAEFTLRFPSVGATETLIMAAVRAKGKTVLYGAATEPEIGDLIRFLQSAGAHITGAGTSTLRITGCESLQGTNHRVCPDRIVAATVLCAVAGCGGEVLLRDCDTAALTALFPPLRALGCVFSASGRTSLGVASRGPRAGVGAVATGVYPDFCTDAAPLLAAACLRAHGETTVTDTIFENRFACADGFYRLGAHVARHGGSVTIQGVRTLYGAPLEAMDLRGGAALVIAAMQAEGESAVTGTQHLRRGYEDIGALFAGLGAHITTVRDASA